MTAPVTIRSVMSDPALFGEQFGGQSFQAWRALLAGFYGEPLEQGELYHWKELTGRDKAPTKPHEEMWVAAGRRAGKSQCAAVMAIFESAFKDYTDRLAPGEVAHVLVVAADRGQAKSIMRYVSGLLRGNPMLESMIVREDRESIELSNRTAIEIGTASFRTTRGKTLGAVILDEIAFLRSDDSANPDREIVAALRPGLATLGGKLIAISSPYAKQGELWETYRRYYGKEGEILVAQAESRRLNPELPQAVVDRAIERDADAAKSEYLGLFRDDISSFITRTILDAVTRSSPLVRPYDRRYRYHAFVDPAGGGNDEFTMAIGHTEGNVLVVDRVDATRGVPAEITEKYAAIMGEYRIKKASLDRYGGSWPSDELRRHGVTAEHSPKVRSDLYIDSLSVITSGRCELPPDETMLRQWQTLERRTSRSGRDTVDHTAGTHDDRANAAAGLIALHSQNRSSRPLSEWI